jgi:hypothetical protein
MPGDQLGHLKHAGQASDNQTFPVTIFDLPVVQGWCSCHNNTPGQPKAQSEIKHCPESACGLRWLSDFAFDL